ncbi:MAG: leucine-rich repeat domain-containing protein, partial [Elusimicrobiales bacterium]|nr:leucine-rich repeat domain-containing protein [Elusimicrobiales bacterium]
MAYRKVNDTSLASVADAIRAKGGTSDALVFPEGFVSAISAIQTGGGGGGGAAPSAKWSDVTFIDYDGTVLYSYSMTEAQALTELPALPTHDGLVCQGWNWTLDSIKALNRPVTVGAMYITDDGATRLHIRIATVGRMTVPLYIGQTVANGVSIDWGDGSAVETLAGTGNVNTSHTYAEPGDYVILLMPEDGCTLSFGASSSDYCVMGPNRNNGRVYCNMLQDVSVGKNVTSIGAYAFQNCYSLESITIPDGVTSIGAYAFYN